MRNNRQKQRSRLVGMMALGMSVLVGAWVAADDHMPGPDCEEPMATYCYLPTWIGTYQQSQQGGCQLYVRCPSMVLCSLNPSGNSQPAGGIVPNTNYPCMDFQQGTGTNSSGDCIGGIPAGQSTITVNIPVQACAGTCITTSCP